jgi:hypothetical protein
VEPLPVAARGGAEVVAAEGGADVVVVSARVVVVVVGALASDTDPELSVPHAARSTRPARTTRTTAGHPLIAVIATPLLEEHAPRMSRRVLGRVTGPRQPQG